jgi:hypothetical protein
MSHAKHLAARRLFSWHLRLVANRVCDSDRDVFLRLSGRLLDPRMLSNFEPFATHRLVGREFGRCALEYDPSVAHHIDAMRYPHGD